MGNVLVSLDDDDEAFLRRLAQERYHSKKGSISSVVSDALDEMKKKGKKERAIANLIRTMEKGYKLGFRGYKKRSEIYD
ncbi:hypothetical protein H0O02_03190 [Candidatus Micrarchaeota archaeon]|nr:hypothetical protein [Candidatus Micrarchaeota archaeon]